MVDIKSKNYPKVLLVTPIKINNKAGGGVTLGNLFKGWDKKAIGQVYNSDMIQADTSVCELFWKFEPEIFNENPAFHLRKEDLDEEINQLVKEIKAEFIPDVIYTDPRENPIYFIWLGQILAEKLKVPYVIHIMDDWPARFEAKHLAKKELFHLLFKDVINKASLNIGISPEMCEAFEKKYNKPFLPFHNVIDVEKWSNVQKDYSQKNAHFNVVYIGVVTSDKELQGLIDIRNTIITLNKTATQNLKFTIYSAHHWEGTIKKHLLFKDQVVYGGFIEQAHLPQTLVNADLLVLPINFDENSLRYIQYSIQTKVPEYMASGTSILVYAPKKSPNTRYALEEKWGKVVSVRNLDLLQQTIQHLIENQEERALYGKTARKLAFKNHDGNLIRIKFLEEIKNAIARFQHNNWNKAPKVPIYKFQANSSFVEKAPFTLSNFLKTKELKSFVLWIKPSYNDNSFSDYQENSPPMPLLIGPVALYDKGTRLIGVVKKKNGELLDHFEIRNELNWLKIGVCVNENSLVVYNGIEKIYEITGTTFLMHESINIGNGYLSRFWKGQIGSAIFFEGNIFDSKENSPKYLLNSIESFDKYFHKSSVNKKIESLIDTLTVSVITPSYNQGSFLNRCLTSVNTQTVQPVEHFIFDPGSTDNSRAIATAFAKAHLYVKNIFEPDTGQSNAINKGLLMASGDIIAWLNSDDSYFDEKVFEKVIQIFKNHPEIDVIYGKGVYINEQGDFIRNAFINKDPNLLSEQFPKSVGILQPAAFFRKSIFKKIGLLREDLNFCMDYEFWMRALRLGLKFKFIDTFFAKASYYTENKTYGQRGKSYKEICQVCFENFGYVHQDWLRKYAEYLVGGYDGILQTAGNHSDKEQLITTKMAKLDKQFNALKTEYRIHLQDNPNKLSIKGLEKTVEYYTEHRKSDTCVILGNGPSLKPYDLEEDFDGMDTIGMNSAYRYWEKIGWYPSFYCCLDEVVGMSHKEAILQLIRNAEEYGIRVFLLRTNLVNWLKGQVALDKVWNFDELKEKFIEFNTPTLTTGSHSCIWATILGYKKIYIIGVDCNYVEKVTGAKALENHKLVITKKSQNPNYFFEGYQAKGDEYNVPNPFTDLHIKSWRNIARLVHKFYPMTKIYNSSVLSRMDAFPFAPLISKKNKQLIGPFQETDDVSLMESVDWEDSIISQDTIESRLKDGDQIYLSKWTNGNEQNKLGKKWRGLIKYEPTGNKINVTDNVVAFPEKITPKELIQEIYPRIMQDGRRLRDKYIAPTIDFTSKYIALGILHPSSVPYHKKLDAYQLQPPFQKNYIMCNYLGKVNRGEEITFTINFSIDTTCELFINLCRDGNEEFESSGYAKKLIMGQHSLLISHTFKKPHNGFRIQIAVKDKTVNISQISTKQI